jgi:hypothetical protein
MKESKEGDEEVGEGVAAVVNEGAVDEVGEGNGGDKSEEKDAQMASSEPTGVVDEGVGEGSEESPNVSVTEAGEKEDNSLHDESVDSAKMDAPKDKLCQLQVLCLLLVHHPTS